MKISLAVLVLGLVGAVWSRPDDSYLTNKVSAESDSDEYGQSRGPKGTSCPCGWTNKDQGRIVGGVETKINEYPYMVGFGDLHPRYPAVKEVGIECGASILTKHHALTAAHCTFSEHDSNKGIVVAQHDVSRDRSKFIRVYKVDQMIEHDGWTLKTFKHDIALLVINEGIEFNQAVGPICLPTKQPDIVGQHVKITGWGEVQSSSVNGDVLRKVSVRVIKLDHCKGKYPHQKIELDTPSQMCTFSHKRDSCQGDSGGPLAWLDPETNRYTLVGVVSFSEGCASTKPGVNTNVFHYLGWIQDLIKKTSPKPVNTCAKV